MIPIEVSWAYIGTIYLMILTWQDYKNNMMVDDRHNFLMIGFTSAMYPYFITDIHKILLIVLYGFVLGFFINKFNILGSADIKTIIWMFTGFTIINTNYLITLSCVFAGSIAIYQIIKKIMKINDPAPFYLPILFSFTLVAWYYGVY